MVREEINVLVKKAVSTVTGQDEVRRTKTCYAGRNVLDIEKTAAAIHEKLQKGTPFVAARLGSSETGGMVYPERKLITKAQRQRVHRELCFNAGFFPDTEEAISKYAELMKASCRDVDLMGVLFWAFEEYALKKYAPKAILGMVRGLEPWYAKEPWSSALAGKKVLVIHPFASTIESQYSKREELFPGTEILPEFELRTFQAVQTIAGGSDKRFSDWFEALDYMTDEALKIPFDVAIIGCGAYGLPLAVRLKKEGHSAIHMGGATQIFFGIKGKRWDDHPVISGLYNDAWVRPGTEERPNDLEKIENGCYW